VITVDCSFCTEFAQDGSNNRIIVQDSGWVLLPTLGCFTPGYCLFMPLDHLDAVADLSNRRSRQVAEVVERMRATIAEVYGPVIVAEHGARGCELGAACCSHAHLHLIPVPDPDAVTAAYEAVGGSGVVLLSLDALPTAVDGPYVYLSPRQGEHCMWAATGFRRQFVRRVCATVHDLDGRYDWRDHPFTGIQQGTLHRLRQAFACAEAA
jgi:diadenosine tetraphosphate (Ap4A) HIT family hydrolase